MDADPTIAELLSEMARLRTTQVESAVAARAPLRRALGMQVGRELYGAPIDSISEIIKLSPITFVPGAPRTILGVTSLRGQILAIVNVRLVLGVAPDPPDPSPLPAATIAPDWTALGPKPRIVVVHHGERTAGLLVDSVTEVYDLSAPVEPPLGGPPESLPLREGQVRVGERLLILLNIPALIARLGSGR